jgi:hypothetical protein
MIKYITANIPGRKDSKFMRDEVLEKALREQGLTFSTTLDWGMDVNYVIAEADSLEQARQKIISHKIELERAYNIMINLDKLYLSPKSTIFDPKPSSPYWGDMPSDHYPTKADFNY